MARRLVLGDVHGAYKALLQVFERSNFDYDKDLLIFLGDICDGWSQTKECIDELLKIKNLIFILGNHDEWFKDYAIAGYAEPNWVIQGGKATLGSYAATRFRDGSHRNVPQSHLDLLLNARDYYVLNNKVFMHGGIPYAWMRQEQLISVLSGEGLRWDRTLWGAACSKQGYKHMAEMLGCNFGAERLPEKFTLYDEIYIGHTSTESFSLEPVRACNVWNLDQGAGWGGKLSLMDIDTKEFWQSDICKELYHEERGRY